MTSKQYTSQEIDRLGMRGTKFLGAVSQVPRIRSILHAGGYSDDDHERGWDLTLRLLGYHQRMDAPDSPQVLRQRAATEELDQWDGQALERSRAALEHRYPEQSRYVFEGLSAGSGAEAIATVRTFLDRVAALRDGTDVSRIATRAEDRAAADLLAVRRIVTSAEELRLRTLLGEATSLPDLPRSTQPDSSQRQHTARELDAWLRDWRATARVLVTRRDDLIRLGLAERRTSKGERGPEIIEPEFVHRSIGD
jgi:hypothetical protein